jgi:hypothetical protein
VNTARLARRLVVAHGAFGARVRVADRAAYWLHLARRGKRCAGARYGFWRTVVRRLRSHHPVTP